MEQRAAILCAHAPRECPRRARQARHRGAQERLSGCADYGGQDYSSQDPQTRGLPDWTYGFIEVRAKLACGKGLWPAIWMLGSDERAGWPGSGEIDIMEHVGWDPGRVHGSIHQGI